MKEYSPELPKDPDEIRNFVEAKEGLINGIREDHESVEEDLIEERKHILSRLNGMIDSFDRLRMKIGDGEIPKSFLPLANEALRALYDEQAQYARDYKMTALSIKDLRVRLEAIEEQFKIPEPEDLGNN